MADEGKTGSSGEESLKTAEATHSSSESKDVDVTKLIDEVSKISIKCNDESKPDEIFKLALQLCHDKDTLKNVLDSQTLNDSTFIEKLAILFNAACQSRTKDEGDVRRLLISYLQMKFEERNSTRQTNKQNFMKEVMFFGYVYHHFKIHEKPINVLGIPFLDYIDMLLEGDELELQLLAKQLIMNINILLTNKALEKEIDLLKIKLRTRLITSDLNSKSRCWILLCLDYMSNNFKPLTGSVKDFYLENIGDEILTLEEYIKSCDNNESNKTNIQSSKENCNMVPYKHGSLTQFALDHLASAKKQDFNVPNKNTDKNLNNRKSGPIMKNDAGDSRMNSPRWKQEGRTRNREGYSKMSTGFNKKSIANIDDDDVYGIQLSKDKITKDSLGKSKSDKPGHFEIAPQSVRANAEKGGSWRD